MITGAIIMLVGILVGFGLAQLGIDTED